MAAEREYAETIAIQALGWIVGHEELLPAFLGASGVAPEELRQRAGDADFLASVLDFLLMNDPWITGFCDAAGLAYDAPRRARAALPGASVDDWL